MSIFDEGVIMGRREVVYYQCSNCRLVSLPSPTWLDEAYASPISDHDQGLLRRCRALSTFTGAIIRAERLRRGRFLDWAGGYGILTQMMRDKGYDYWHHDDYATAMFARGFQDDGTEPCDLVTAFEVMEHLVDPRNELADLSKRADRLLFSTLLLPEPTPRAKDWWYYTPEVGQHVTFHTEKSLRILASHLGYQLTSNGRDWHMFHRTPLKRVTRALLSRQISTAKAKSGAAFRNARNRAS